MDPLVLRMLGPRVLPHNLFLKTLLQLKLIQFFKVLMNIMNSDVLTIMTVYLDYQRAPKCPFKYETSLKQLCQSDHETEGVAFL